jgi:hypothetical protein
VGATRSLQAARNCDFREECVRTGGQTPRPASARAMHPVSSGTDYCPITRLLFTSRCTIVTSPWGCSSAYSFQTAMATMDSPQRSQRSSIRYQLQLPVSLKLADKELYAQSESIGLAGILLSSSFLIPEGSAVELSVGIVRSRPGTFLCGRGKVVRTEQKETGDFALAIKLDRDFEFGPSNQRRSWRPVFHQGL